MKRKFKSEKEEAKFWETHSPLDYPEEFTEVMEPFQFSPALLRRMAKRRRERKRTLTFRIGQQQVDLAKVIADLRGLGYQTLMRMWIIEGIYKEIHAHPEIKKLMTHYEKAS